MRDICSVVVSVLLLVTGLCVSLFAGGATVSASGTLEYSAGALFLGGVSVILAVMVAGECLVRRRGISGVK